MLAYQRGDTSAFERLYRRHKDAIVTFLFRQCGDTGVAEEIAQETWMALIDAAPRYQPEATFRTWLFRIGRNKLIDHWRRQAVRPEVRDAVAGEVTAPDRAEQSAREQQLLRAIGQLPAEQRDALLLFEQGFSLRDIAHITAVAEETVKSRLRYGRKQLRHRLGGEI